MKQEILQLKPQNFQKNYKALLNYEQQWQHTPVLAWKIPWTEEPGRLQSMRSLRVGYDSATSLSLFTFCIGEGNDNPLQCSCLENPRDRGAWWAAVSGVAQSWTRPKRFSSSSSSKTKWFYENIIQTYTPCYYLNKTKQIILLSLGIENWILKKYLLEMRLVHLSDYLNVLLSLLFIVYSFLVRKQALKFKRSEV